MKIARCPDGKWVRARSRRGSSGRARPVPSPPGRRGPPTARRGGEGATACPCRRRARRPR
eukprot:8985337-Alexandrium_andersonii.AAC.1